MADESRGAFEISYPVRVAPEPGYEGVACILDSDQRLIAAMMHPEHAAEVVGKLNGVATCDEEHDDGSDDIS